MTKLKKSSPATKKVYKIETERAEATQRDVESLAEYFRLHKDDETKKILAVIKLRNLAFLALTNPISEYFRPLPEKAPRMFTSRIKLEEIYTTEKIIKEWNLTAGETYQFSTQLIEYEGLTASQHSAAFLLYFCIKAIEQNAVPDYMQESILSAFAEIDSDSFTIGDAVIAGSNNARKVRALGYEPEHVIWINTAKSIIALRKRKPGQRELARLVAKELNPQLGDDEINKCADSRRKWIADLL